jgi:hypothetical protein
MEWRFKQDTDRIFDIMKKTAEVIKSCDKEVQLEGAYNYVANLKRYLTFFEKTKREQEFCDKQILEFRKMLKIKRRYLSELSK